MDKEFEDSDLIISHCGAGTILEVLLNEKQLICVINNSLMNNHQNELYNKLKGEQFIYGIDNLENFYNEFEMILNEKTYKTKPFKTEKKDILSESLKNLFDY